VYNWNSDFQSKKPRSQFYYKNFFPKTPYKEVDMKALIRRQVSPFGVCLQWDGDEYIKVMDGESVIDSILISGLGVRSALEAMKQLEDQMHSSCQAMELIG
jgi:hypothetical protein